MNKLIIFFTLVFYFSIGNAQGKKITLSNDVEVTLIKKNENKTEIVLFINKPPSCFQDIVTQTALNKVLKDYSERNSYENRIVRFLPNKIIYKTNEDIDITLLNFRDIIQGFNINSSKVYLSELRSFYEMHKIKDNGIKSFAIHKMYPDYSYPLLSRNITSKKIKQISDEYKNAIGINNIRLKISGHFNRRITPSTVRKQLENLFRQWDLKEFTAKCEKIATSKPFFIYKPFFPLQKGIEMYAIYHQNRKLGISIKEHLIKTFGDKNIVFHSFDDFSEIQIFQKTDQADGMPLLSKLKTFAQNNALNFSDFGIVVSGAPQSIYNSFNQESITYLNEKEEKINNPFVYRDLPISGKEVIDNYLTTIGKKQLLDSIKNTRSVYKLIMNEDTLKVKIEVLNALPYKKIKKIWVEDKLISYNAFDGERGWIDRQGTLFDYTKKQNTEAILEASIIPQQFYPIEKVKAEGLVIKKSKKYKDKQLYKISIRMGDYIVYEYYDRGSNLLVRQEFCKEPYTPVKTIYYDDYSKYEGLIIPFKLRIVEKDTTSTLILTQRIYNSRINPDEFLKKNRTKLLKKDESMLNDSKDTKSENTQGHANGH